LITFRIKNIPSERKELKHYVFSTLSFTDHFYDCIDLPEARVPKDLQEFAHKTLLSLGLLFHPANELITHLILDIEVCEVFQDIKQLGTEIILPHLQPTGGNLKPHHEHSYR
jgi:hypothetical protein